MNAADKEERILAEMGRSHESLEAAKNLFNDELFADSISRAYYAIFHAARAILLTKDIDPETHNGAISLFGLHFVKPGIIENKYGKIFNEAKDDRESGDYLVTRKFSKTEAQLRVNQATIFVSMAKMFLKI
jgi:uncharacterized protein (UPF0332 family)